MLERYDRQIAYEGIGKVGQEKISKSKVCVIGCGALGTAILNSLCRSGIGHIIFVDDDTVELTNLQRQMLFDENDVGKYKAHAVFEKLDVINSEVIIEGYVDRISADNISIYAEDCDIILDATDNFQTRQVINSYCITNNKPWVYGGVAGSCGMATTIIPFKTPCLNCLSDFKTNEGYTAKTSGIINAITASIGSIEANLAIRYLIGKPSNKFIYFDLFNDIFQCFELKQNPNCKICGGK